MKELKNCPQEYYYNCKNAVIKCNMCKAGYGIKKNCKLYYSPISTSNTNLSLHPIVNKLYIPSKPNKRSKSISQGLISEKKFVQHLNSSISHILNSHTNSTLDTISYDSNLVKQTLLSGRVNHDGDAAILNTIRVEHKLRPSTTKSYHITRKEYEKGKEQGIDVWAISIENSETLYILSESLFSSFIAFIKESLDSSSPN